jgi:hypothetical protein
MEKRYEFIDSTKRDRSTKRLARSHAMKGKNAGKTLHRRSRLDLGRRPVTLMPVAECQHDDASYRAPTQYSLGVTSPTLDSSFLSFSFPVEATPKTRSMIGQCKSTALQLIK